MQKSRSIFFSSLAIAVVVGGFIPFNWLGLNGMTVQLAVNNDNSFGSFIPVQQSSPNNNDAFKILRDSSPPLVSDPNLKVEKVVKGLDHATSMKFVGPNDILVLEKDKGTVRLVSNGKLQPDPIFRTTVESASERGMLGLAVSNANANDTGPVKNVFLYFTQNSTSGETKNWVYEYDWDGTADSELNNGRIILDLPGTPGPNHNAGKLVIDPRDGDLYAVLGDLNRDGTVQNFKNKAEPDGTSAIYRIDQQSGNAAENNPLSDNNNDPLINAALSKYYAYGVRNSFGLAIDPVTGKLWDTENGATKNDEINVVNPGFNSGWQKVMGPIERTGKNVNDLVQFTGSHYNDPVFTWSNPIGVTDIEFLNSTKLGDKYTNNIFVGDFNNGNLYFFTVNNERNGILLDDKLGLQDKVADNPVEASQVTFGTGFSGGITDLETGPDGYLYVLTLNGSIYRIVPAGGP